MHIGCLIISEFGEVSHLAYVPVRGLEGDAGCSHGVDGLGQVGVSPGRLSMGVFLMGWGSGGPKVIFLSYFTPFRHLLATFCTEFFLFIFK